MKAENQSIPEVTRLEASANQNTEKRRRDALATAIIQRMRKEKRGCLDAEIRVELDKAGLGWPTD